MRRSPPLPAVRVFEAIARCGTFTAAADELGMTQAAVSYQIKLLEERLGVSLFQRRGRRAVMTDAAARAAGQLREAFDKIDAAFDELRGDETILRISASSTFTERWLARHIGSFQADNPEVDIRLDVSNRYVDFASEDVDVAIRWGNGDWPGLAKDRLFDLDFTPMCAPGLVNGMELPLPASAALSMRWINPQDHWWAAWLSDNGIAADGRPTQKGVMVDSQATEGLAALAGQGLAMLTPALWQGELEDGRLVAPFTGISHEGEAYWLVYRPSQRRALRITRFRQWMLAAFGSAPGESADTVRARAR